MKILHYRTHRYMNNNYSIVKPLSYVILSRQIFEYENDLINIHFNFHWKLFGLINIKFVLNFKPIKVDCIIQYNLQIKNFKINVFDFNVMYY